MSGDGRGARRVAVAVTDGPGREAVEHLVADLSEALPVYARLAGVEAPELSGAVRGCDAVLLGWSGGRSGDVPARAAAPGTPVYALCAAGGADGGLAGARRLCEAAGLRWMGGAAVTDPAFALAAAPGPRMGVPRRGASEAVDRIAVALLAGSGAEDALVRPPRPRWLWMAVARAW